MSLEDEPSQESRMTPAIDNRATGIRGPAADPPAGELLDGAWELDPRRSSVEFRTGNLWGLQTVNGRFDNYQGKLDLSATSAIDLTIEAGTVQTGNRKRDEHLCSSDFFDVENYPEVQFVSDSVQAQGETLRVRGRLSARGRSIPVELDAHVRRVDGGLELKAVTTVPHRELGMTWSPLRTIRPHTELTVNAYVIPDVAGGD
jgi:polyisoprenoid-binding protein YceI